MKIKLTVLLIMLSFFGLRAQTVPYNEEFRVNTTNEANKSCVSGLTNNGFVVCWQANDGSGNGIFGQMYSDIGIKSGTEFQVNTYTSNYQDSPAISYLAGGGFVVCWRSYAQDGDSDGIFGQMYNSDEQKSGDEFQVNTYTSSFQTDPKISTLSNGRFVICWRSYGQDGDASGIFAQLYNDNGTKIGDEFQVNTHVSDSQIIPSITALSGGGFVICWESEGQDGDRTGIFGQMFNLDGAKQGDEFQVNTFTTGLQSSAYVAGLSDSGYVVCWESDNQDGDAWGIFGQMYDKNGIKYGEEFRVNTYTSGSQAHPSICGLSNGGFVVCWQSYGQDGSDWGVFGQLYKSDGMKFGDEFQLNAYTDRMQYYQSASSLANGNFVVFWDSFGQSAGHYNIYGKYYLGMPLLHPLHSFSLIYPAFDAIIYTTEVNLRWEKPSSIYKNFPWELKYKLYVDETEEFSDPQIFTDIYETNFTVTQLTPERTYFWKVLAKNSFGDSLWCSETFGFYVNPATAIEDKSIPRLKTFKLYPNYPNPFNPMTMINYQLPITNYVTIIIFNLVGQKVATLVNERKNAGYYQVEWDATGFSSGVYFCIMQAGSFRDVQKMLVVR